MESDCVEKGTPSLLSLNFRPQQNTVSNGYPTSNNSLAAVVVRNADKSYISGTNVVKGLNMTVQQGTIYSLLGGSGCGKTTTLSCIVGLKKFTSGEVWLFGKKPGSTEIAIPGRNIGYMPQGYSLCEEFTILETFKYFGLLNGMEESEIMSTIQFYTNLLQLPKYSNQVGNLSGGQKRRVSLAISLQHAPELILLDEPTVGIDALLRESIWKHLVHLTKSKQTTVIITTHYIEEARYSDKVGVMNDGKLIAEDSPSSLMIKFETNSLDLVVTWLTINSSQNTTSAYKATATNVPIPPMASISSKTSSKANSLKRIHAMLFKNWAVATRNLTMLLVTIAIPALSLLTIFVGIGTSLTSVKFGAVNDELTNSSTNCHEAKTDWDGTCNLNYFSCKYLMHLSPPVFDLIEFRTRQEAEKAVSRGKIWGYVYFPPGFSEHLFDRATSGLKVNPDTLQFSNIVARLDKTSTITTRLLSHELFAAYQNFVRTTLADCDYDPRIAEYTLSHKNPPIIGANVLTFLDFIIPSAFVAFMSFWPIVSAGLRYVGEKRQGTMERSLLAGSHMWEIFFSYTITEFFISVLRIVIMYLLMIVAIKVNSVGSLWLQFSLGLLTSFQGVAAGFLLGSFCTEETQIALLSLAIFMPNMLVSGMIWPLEGMSPVLQKITYALPCTLVSEAMKSITNRGWDFYHPTVWPGFAIPVVYICIFLILAKLGSTLKSIK